MSHHRANKATVTKRKLLLYLLGVFIVARVAAHVDGDSSMNNTLEEKIAAFKKGGVGKEINTDHYDREGIIQFAEALVGTPHAMGGYSPSGLDCSGLVKLAHAQYEVDLPRSSHDQARYGTILSAEEELKRGDLVFFHSTYKKKHLVTHTGIYLGDNKFIHASASRGVIVSTLHDSGYYDAHYLFATRLVD
jgi:murein DD-endopeptidase / murein LD-carboxypeptidase